MTNLARSTSPLADRDPAALLDDLRAGRAGAGPLPVLPPAVYARAHAAFESRSDQRRLIEQHLAGRLALRGGGPVALLSVGCGDGTLDARLATVLADAEPTRPVRYVGVDPYAGSTSGFAAALGALDRPNLAVETHADTFADATVGGTFDVVTFVHSMYYVADVEETLLAAYALLRPGGELLVLSGPRAELNTLAALLAPPVDGRSQWFGDDVATALAGCTLPVADVTRLEARLDLAGADDDVLDFTVQARLTPGLREEVRAYLGAVGAESPGSGSADRFTVPHPVDVYRVTRPA